MTLRLCGLYTPSEEDVVKIANYLIEHYPEQTAFADILDSARNDDILHGMLIDTVTNNIIEHIATYLENCQILLLAHAVVKKDEC